MRDVQALANFAGSATYRHAISLDAGLFFGGGKVVLDLGAVHDMVTVTVNSRAFVPTISRPFRGTSRMRSALAATSWP